MIKRIRKFNVKNKDINLLNSNIIPLDSRVKHEYDNIESSSCHSRAQTLNLISLSPSGERSIFPTLSPSGLTRGSSRKKKHCFSGYSYQSTNMTKGNNTLSMTTQSDRIPPSVTLGRSETKTRGSRIMNAYASAFRIAESGRSMVEMLGTLAIIGVLSVGAIGGYSYAMDKHKANQTINDIMLMGVDMMTQTSQNRSTAPSLTEWGTKTTAGYNFEVVPNPDNASQYGIQISGVPSRVCKMVGDGLQETVAVYVGNKDYTSGTETDPCDESDNNTMEFYFTSQCSPECGENEVCDNGLCISTIIDPFLYLDPCTTNDTCGECAVCQDGYCYATAKQNKYCAGGVGTCYNGICETPQEEGCTSNDDCNHGQYCASPNISPTEAFPAGKYGHCRDLDAVRFKYTNSDGQTQTFYLSNYMITYWDAQNFCAALGKTLSVDISELVKGYSSEQSGPFEPTDLAKKIATLRDGIYVMTSNTTIRESDGNVVYIIVSTSGHVGATARKNGGSRPLCR